MDFKNYNVVDGFNLIAPAYDLANDAMTLGLHRLWRKKLCQAAVDLTPKGGRLLDVATGTADVILGILKCSHKDFSIAGIDPSEGMLEIGRQKLQQKGNLYLNQVELRLGDARQTGFPDNSFDTVTVAWGIRNVRPYSEGLREILRILKPGGHLLILESGKPEFKAVRMFYKYYSKMLPIIGKAVSGFKPAYQYYTQTVDSFPSGTQFVADLFDSGFSQCTYKSLGGSIVYLYQAQKPGR